MIVSASYRTDIPAFYGPWFLARLREGHCRVTNPYGGPDYEVRLDPESVSGFVFWTKNLGPFLPHLPEIGARGHGFVVQYTINAYPRALENRVVRPDDAVAHMSALARDRGRRGQVWRYDPILDTSLTPPAWHRDNFARLARQLAGATDEVVISFAHIYRKTARNLETAARYAGFEWRDPSGEEKRALAVGLAEIAADFGMRLTLCAQPEFECDGVSSAACIDAERLSDVTGKPVKARRKGNRPGCGCWESRDIGAYDTCPHGCVYCYAVGAHDRARTRFRDHHPANENLLADQAALASRKPENAQR